jgi:hypothetical protein
MDIKRYNGKLYAIRSFKTDLIYIGSTCEKRLSARMGKHRCSYRSYLNQTPGCFFITSYEILQYEDAFIELILECENITKDELRRVEGEHIRKNNCVNKIIAGRTHQEYLKDENEKIQKCQALYRAKNIENHAIANKRWAEKNFEKLQKKNSTKYICKCGKNLVINHKSRHDKVCKAQHPE